MAQIAIIQPAAPQAPTANLPVNNGQNQFSPHLENALSSNKQQFDSQNHPKNPTSPLITEGSDDLTSLGPDVAELVNELSMLQTAQPSVRFEITHMDSPLNAEISPAIPSTTPELAAMEGMLTAEMFPVTATVTPDTSLLPQAGSGTSALASSPVTEQQTVDYSFRNGSAGSGQLQFPMAETVDLLEVQPEASSYSTKLSVAATSSPAVMNSESEALLGRLQQIINNSSETGTVSVTQAERSPSILASTTEALPLNSNGLLLASGEGGLKMTSERSDQQLNSIRLDTQQQYYEAKVGLQNGGENSTTSQDSHQDSDTPSQPSPTAVQNGLAAETEGATSTFSQAASIAQEHPVQISTETSKPIILPSGAIVHEEEIVQQLIERFQISGKLTDTKINIKLNPAELGELKIDISVKDGSIKAHVVAQSQQALEVIEKNIGRLKTVLEDQGYTIDEISVTSESDSVGDFDLFDKQLFSQSDDTPPGGKDSNGPGANFDPEIFLQDDSDEVTGVNVRI